MNTLHKRMIKEICEYFGVQFQEIFTRRRYKKLVYAKKVIYWILRREGLTFNQIANIVKKDHETVIMGVRTLPDEYKPYALSICSKYKKWGLKDALEQENEQKRQKRIKIVNLLNEGKSVSDISTMIKESIGYVNEQISLFLEPRKVPNYKSGEYFIKYFEKNKKNY